MANVNYTIEIDETVFNLVVEAFSVKYGYQNKIKNEAGEEIDNPVTKVQFLRQCTANFWKDVVSSYVREQAVIQAEAALPELNVQLDIV